MASRLTASLLAATQAYVPVRPVHTEGAAVRVVSWNLGNRTQHEDAVLEHVDTPGADWRCYRGVECKRRRSHLRGLSNHVPVVIDMPAPPSRT